MRRMLSSVRCAALAVGKDLRHKLGYVHALDGGGGKSKGREHSEENEPAHLNLPRGYKRRPEAEIGGSPGREACIELYTDLGTGRTRGLCGGMEGIAEGGRVGR